MAKRIPLPGPVAVREVLQRLMKPLDWENLGQRSRIRQVWEKMVPPEILPHTRLLEVRRRELWVEVSVPKNGPPRPLRKEENPRPTTGF